MTSTPEPPVGIEPTFRRYECLVLTFNTKEAMVGEVGFEPTYCETNTDI